MGSGLEFYQWTPELCRCSSGGSASYNLLRTSLIPCTGDELFSQSSFCWLISSVVAGPVRRWSFAALELCRNLGIHAPILNVCQRVPLRSRSSNSFRSSTAKVNSCLHAFVSTLDSGLALVTMSGGQLVGSLSQVGLSH